MIEPVSSVKDADGIDSFDRRDQGARAGVENDLIGENDLVAGPNAKAIAIAALQSALSANERGILFSFEVPFEAAALAVYDAARTGDHRREIHFHGRNAQTEFAGPAREMSQPSGCDRRLGRRATEVHAGAAQVFAFDERRLPARLCQGQGERNSGLTGSDDHNVIAVHLFSSIADKRFSLREIQCKP